MPRGRDAAEKGRKVSKNANDNDFKIVDPYSVDPSYFDTEMREYVSYRIGLGSESAGL